MKQTIYYRQSGYDRTIYNFFIIERETKAFVFLKRIKQHVKDPYVKQSQLDGYRSRASYKLLEIVEKGRYIKSGMVVVDLGSAPGGWSQVAAKLVGHKGCVVAVDILPMDPVAGVSFIQGDFTEEEILNQLLGEIGNRPVDLVI